MNPNPRRAFSRKRLIIVLSVLIVAFGFLVGRGLTDATVYFRTADEAVAQKQALGSKRFRLEGTVLAGSVKQDSDRVQFIVEGSKSQVAVQHTGDEPGLFREGIPVVLEGRFAGDTFQSTQILIKHSETYREENPVRVKDYPQ